MFPGKSINMCEGEIKEQNKIP